MSTFFEVDQSSALPANFAQSVLDLEMQMEFEESSTLTAVKQLNDLYLVHLLLSFSWPLNTISIVRMRGNWDIFSGNYRLSSHIQILYKSSRIKMTTAKKIAKTPKPRRQLTITTL